jgi:hypothetical protein
VEASFPLEPFNSYMDKGIAGEVLESIKPEAAYFTDNGVGRGALLIVDLPEISHVPRVTEPLMAAFGASVHYRIAILPPDLQSAGLERYAAA